MAGLSTAEARRRLLAEGPNEVARRRPRRLVSRVAAQLSDPLILLLLIAAAATTLLGDISDTIVITLVVVLNTAIGVTQQIRADRAIIALDDLTAPTARVIRDGTDTVIAAAQLVREDVVRLAAGDIVPADLVMTEAFRCQVDEAALTGESMPLARETGEELQAGTVVVTGRATGVVCRTGSASALGRIASLVSDSKAGLTPLQRRLARLSRLLGATAVALCLLVFLIGVARGEQIITMALIAVSLVVAAVPESLPAVVTLALALGARRMARHHAIPRNLHAVETLGSVTVLASDKTGTLTQGRMAVREAVADTTAHTITGEGYSPRGQVFPDPTPELVELARTAVLCSDATISPEGKANGDPLEAALVAFAARVGLDPQQVRLKAPRIAEHPFDQATRQMTTIHRVPGEVLTICKGAPESVLVQPVIDAGDPALMWARKSAETLAAQGLRVMAVAAGRSASPGNPAAPRGLRVLGVVGIGDPLRDNARETADSFELAGIRLILITGDHPATAAAIAGEVGIWHPGDLVGTGEHPEDSHRVRVFARTRPEQKLDIIADLQAHAHVVAMTGDGVNDAPALRRADIGVAMGGGTEVARQSADLVLVDDNLGTLTVAVGEGRRVYDNIRRFLRYGLAGGAAEILVMLLGPLLGMPVPLLAGQILWVNLLTHGPPGVAMGAEPPELDVLRRPPRPPKEQVLGDGLWRGMLVLGVLLAMVTLTVGGFAARVGWPWQSMLFVTLGLSQLGLAIALRPSGSWRRNPGLLVAVAGSALAQLAAVTLPPLRALLGTHPLSMIQIGVCVLAALVPAVAAWAVHHSRVPPPDVRPTRVAESV